MKLNIDQWKYPMKNRDEKIEKIKVNKKIYHIYNWSPRKRAGREQKFRNSPKLLNFGEIYEFIESTIAAPKQYKFKENHT